MIEQIMVLRFEFIEPPWKYKKTLHHRITFNKFFLCQSCNVFYKRGL
nr:MAG TPA: hypothetical protein [Caudoviricetes sp.]